MNYYKMKLMTKDQYLTIRDISFKTKGYCKNFDLIVTGENIINEYEGLVSKLRIEERKPPIIVGEFGISKWNLSLARELNINLYDLLEIHSNEPSYNEFNDLIKKDIVSFNNWDKIVFVHYLILAEEFRKKTITEEFIEYVHREFYDDKTLIVAHALPFQYNDMLMEYLRLDARIETYIDDINVEEIDAVKYFKLKEVIDKNLDRESNEFKVFSIAQKCGFERIDESYIFKYNPTKIIERLKDKYNYRLKRD